MSRVWVTFFGAVINAETLAFYGSISNIISNRGDVSRAISLGLGAGMGLMTIYRWCNEAQNVEECVSSPTRISFAIIKLKVWECSRNKFFNGSIYFSSSVGNKQYGPTWPKNGPFVSC
jgi:hypothetical protein